jgi:uncharacterized protein (DUF362 family)
MMKMSRRTLIPVTGAGAVAGYATLRNQGQEPAPPPLPPSPVAVLRAASYSDEIARKILDGARLCGLDVRGKNVLLKPNLVEFDRSTAINTDVAVVAAAVEAFRQLGAAEVSIGEGPGHRRDTHDLAYEARYRREIAGFDRMFVDLNRDDVERVEGFAGEPEFYFPGTVLRADLIVSLAKMKTHHWAGATLSMKNLFGLVPGCVYGWPKNKLHYIGISRSIVELNRRFRNTFAIVDGIVGMEGNGPIQGTPKPAGVLAMGRDVAAVDATCCRVMGIDPEGVDYLIGAAGFGNIAEGRIEQRGENTAAVRQDFALIDGFRRLRLS